MRVPLYFSVFLTGAAVLILEVTATRILAPWFGSSIYTVSSVISIILAALSIGYYLGGRLADRFPNHQLFFLLILTGGLLTLATKLGMRYALPFFGSRLSLDWGPLLTGLVLFLLPNIVLGMLSPFAVKLLQIKNHAGQTAGNIFFWSTVGSIFGSLLAGFVLIPRLGVSMIVYYTALGLIALGAVGMLIAKADKKLFF